MDWGALVVYLAVREHDHIAHIAADGHVLHGPGGSGVEGLQPPARLRGGVLRGGVTRGHDVGTAADQNLGRAGAAILEREHDAGAGAGVVPGLPGDGGECLHDRVGVVVQNHRVAVGEDVERAIGQQVDERVPVEVVFDFQESEVEEADAIAGNKLIRRRVLPSQHKDPPVRQQLVGCVPPTCLQQVGSGFHPVARFAGAAGRDPSARKIRFRVGWVGCSNRGRAREGGWVGWVGPSPDFADAVVVSPCLHERAVREELAGAAPSIGLHQQGADGVVRGVEHERVGGAVVRGGLVLRVVAADAVREVDERRANVGSVQEHDQARVRHRCVHACDSYVLIQQRPRRLSPLPSAALCHCQHYHHHHRHSHPHRHCPHLLRARELNLRKQTSIHKLSSLKLPALHRACHEKSTRSDRAPLSSLRLL